MRCVLGALGLEKILKNLGFGKIFPGLNKSEKK